MLLIHSLPGRGDAAMTRSGASRADAVRQSKARSGRFRAGGLGIWLALAMTLFLQPLYAEASLSTGEETVTAGVFEYTTPEGRVPATILTTDYQVTISGLLAETRLRQTFGNTSRQWREGVYLFPLPENATVYGFTLTAGDRVIEGEMQERVQAEQTYQQARTEGRQVARVDQQRPDLFTTHMANIPPGAEVTVEVRFQQPVRYDQGSFELHLPTTLTPRFIPGTPVDGARAEGGMAVPTDQVADADRITPATLPVSALDPRSHWADVVVELSAGLPLAGVSSPSHDLLPVRDGDQVRITPRSGRLRMDRDLVLRWTPVREEAPTAIVFHEHWRGEDYLLTLMVPGEAAGAGQRLPRELILVIDTSGSMAGEPIREARRALLKALDTLGPDDRFNVIQFNTHTHALFSGALPADRYNLEQARRYVQGLNASGGTVMSTALDLALAGEGRAPASAGTAVRQVVFITDGAVGNEQGLFSQIHRQLGETRLFTVGIGAAPNRHFLREAARYGRGTHTLVDRGEDLTGSLDGLFRKMQSPVLTDIRMRWPGTGVEAFPARPGDLFAGEPLMQVSRGVPAGGQLQVSGRQPGGREWQQSLSLGDAVPASGLHRLWAREKAGHLQDAGFGRELSEEHRAAVVALALEHQIMTPFTSFVAVDKTPVRQPEAELETDHLATVMPAGTLQQIPWPRTASHGPLLIRAGAAGLLVALLGWLALRWRTLLPRGFRAQEVRS